MTEIAKNQNNFRVFVIMGRSAAGKGTQARLLVDFLKQRHQDLPDPVLYLETGAMFREYLKGDSYSSELSRQVSAAGARQPDFLAIWLWTELLVKNYSGGKHWVVDGTPRSLSEALAFDTALKFYGFGRATIILLNIPDGVAHDRLTKRGREDDLDRQGNERRLRWFEDDVSPAIDFFRNNRDYHFVTVDGTGGIEKIHQEIAALV